MSIVWNFRVDEEIPAAPAAEIPTPPAAEVYYRFPRYICGPCRTTKTECPNPYCGSYQDGTKVWPRRVPGGSWTDPRVDGVRHIDDE
jgi:hypothetical protein